MDKMDDYRYLRTASIFAGIIGIAQGVAWFGMAITGIMAHFCAIPFTGIEANLGSLFRITLHNMYFRSGSCEPDDLPLTDIDSLEGLNLKSPTHVFIWMWVYMLISLLWIVSSITMITNVKKSQIRFANVFITIWISITAVIIIMDLTCFILFALDYDTIMTQSYETPIFFVTASTTTLMAAQSVSGMMMSIALRGYLLWIINFVMVLYLFILMFKVYTYNKSHDPPKQDTQQFHRGYRNGHTNNAFVNSQENRHAPINAFAMQPQQHQQQRNDNEEIPRVNHRQTVIRPIQHDEKGLGENYQRRMAASTTPDQLSTFHHDDTVLRRDTRNANIVREIKNRNSMQAPNGQQQTFQPPIDYSPQTQRAFDNRPPLRSNLRSFRYN